LPLHSWYEHVWFYNVVICTLYGPILHINLLRTVHYPQFWRTKILIYLIIYLYFMYACLM
jgi:hypothetical protein